MRKKCFKFEACDNWLNMVELVQKVQIAKTTKTTQLSDTICVINGGGYGEVKHLIELCRSLQVPPDNLQTMSCRKVTRFPNPSGLQRSSLYLAFRDHIDVLGQK